MSDNLVGKLVKELQKLGLHQPSTPLPEKLTRGADFSRWEARMKDYLRGVDTSSRSATIMGLLDNEVYDLARSADISASMPATNILDRLRAILAADATALSPRVLEQLADGVGNPEIQEGLDVGATGYPREARDLARQEEALQAVCDRPAQPLLGIAAVQPQTIRDCGTQRPWRPCSRGSYYRPE
nr:unnamed protein product [Spirometra erinaceieuropaei]